jgi:hypothetical protein
MPRSYTAFGLSLNSSFSLPGMQSAEREGLPTLDLTLEGPAELGVTWSGTPDSSAWRGRLGDGHQLKIERGVEGDFLFSYAEHARFHLDIAGARLGCAPRGITSMVWLRVLLGRVLPNVALARGYEALHAAAVETPLGVVAIAAPSGTGKSTLACELIRRGWPLFADDVLVLAPGADRVRAHSASPHMTVPLGAGPGKDFGSTLAALSGERWVCAEEAEPRCQELAAVVILERGPDLSLACEALPSNPIVLAPYMLGLPDDEGRDAQRFALYADLVETSELLRLSGGPDDGPADLADALQRALSLEAPLAVGDAA